MHREQATRLAKERARELRDDLTVSEKTLWAALRRRQLGHRFRRQEPIGPFIVDFVCLLRRLVVEVDGPHHDWDERDGPRDEYLRVRGFRVLRFTNREVTTELDDVLGAIRNYLEDLDLTE
ncbi:MAG: endonuclease domain-containing protein [Acidimicrobiia bacterium]|nr:endonuclease domain-containing protein [Acidimicrobiia bacterium]